MRGRIAYAGILLLALASCTNSKQAISTSAYVPVFAIPSANGQRGSLQGDYDWAAGAKTVAEAVSRWDEFLKKHKPANGEYGDAFHKQHVDVAAYELARAFYLSGQPEKGDRVLKDLDPLQIR